MAAWSSSTIIPSGRCCYSQRQVLLSRPEGHSGTLPVRLVTPTATGPQTPDIDPQYIGGAAAFQGHYATIRYAPLGPASRINGAVKVAGTIGGDGKVSDWRVWQGACPGCDEARLEMLKKLLSDWISAQVEGQPVAVAVLFSMKLLGMQPRM